MKKLTRILSFILVLGVVILTTACDIGGVIGNVTSAKTEAKNTTTENKSVTETPTTAHTHTFSEWVVVEESTCTEKGSKQRTCACGAKETEEIDYADHIYDYANGSFTWVSNGTSGYKAEYGYKCVSCKTQTKSQATVTSESATATCLVTGDTTYTAKVTLGETEYTDTKVVTGELGPHTLTKVDAVAGTDCEHKGTVEYYECSVCNKKFSDNTCTVELTSIEGEFGPHTYDYTNGSFTFTEDLKNGGYKAAYGYKCTICKGDFNTQATVTNESATATCLVTGDTTYTAKVTLGGTEYTDTKVVTGELGPHNYQNMVWYDRILDGYIEAGKKCSVCEDIQKSNVYLNVYDASKHVTGFNSGNASYYSVKGAVVTVNTMTSGASQWCRFDFTKNTEATFKYAYLVVKGSENMCIGAKFDTSSPDNNKYDKVNGNKQYKSISDKTEIIIWDLEKLGMDSKLLEKVVFWPYGVEGATSGSFEVLGAGLCNTIAGTTTTYVHNFNSYETSAEGHKHVCACGEKQALESHTEEEIAKVDPTYDTKGSTAGVKCSVCGYVITAPEEIDKLKYTITFELDGGALEGGITSYDVYKGTPASGLAGFTPTKTGYTFNKWQLKSGETYVDIPENATVTDDITIKAIYTPEKRTLTFNLDGGTLKVGENSITSMEVNYDTPATELASLVPTKTGYTFSKWQIVTQSGNIDVPSGAVVQDNLTLIAIYTINKYTITFNLDGGTLIVEDNSITSMEVDYNTDAEGLASFVPAKAGYTFSGWYIDETEVVAGMKVTEDITIEAHYELATDTPYTVKHLLLKADGTTQEIATDNLSGTTLDEVTATAKSNDYYYDSRISTVKGNIAADGTLVLNLYYRTKYTISTYANLTAIKDNMYGYYELANDIDFWNGSNRRFNYPIGFVSNENESNPFKGILEGNGYKISYDYSWTSDMSNHNRGLFYVLGSTAIVKNVQLVVGTDENNGVKRASLAWRNYGLIENVYVNMTLYQGGQDTNANNSACGLVCANMASGVINNCVVKVTYTSTIAIADKAAGICYQNIGTIKNSAFISIINNSAAGTMKEIAIKDGNSTNANIVTATSIEEFVGKYDGFVTNGFNAGTLWKKEGRKVTFNETVVAQYYNELDITSISFNDSFIQLSKDTQTGLNSVYTLGYKFQPEGKGITDTFAFSSSNPSVVTVDAQGNLEAVGYGKATITITSTNGTKATIDVISSKNYEVSGPQQLTAISSDIYGYYKLTNDLYLGTLSVTPIAEIAGTLDLNGHKIVYSFADSHYIRLATKIASTATVKNGTFVVTSSTGNKAGQASLCEQNYGLIENCFFDARFLNVGQSLNDSANMVKAGAVCKNFGTINNCIAKVTYSGTTLTAATSNCIAGLCGVNDKNGKITNCGVLFLATNSQSTTTAVLKDYGTQTNVVYCTTEAELLTKYTNLVSGGFVPGTFFTKDETTMKAGDNYIIKASDVATSVSINETFVRVCKDTQNGVPVTYQLNVTTVPASVNDILTYSTSDSSIITVSSTGLITAVGYGKAYAYVLTSTGLVASVEVVSVKYYELTTATEVRNIANDMYGYYVLKNDIDFWNGSNRRMNEPIGLDAGKQTQELKPFYGILDGNGYKITYEYSYGGVNTNNHDRGLFYVLGSTAIVKNVQLVVGTDTNNGVRRASLAWRNYGLIENVYVNMTLYRAGQAKNANNSACGLVCANMGTGVISNCVVKVTYTSTIAIDDMAAGICYQNSGTVKNSAFISIVNNSAAGTMKEIAIKDANSTNTNIVSVTSLSAAVDGWSSFVSSGFDAGTLWTCADNTIKFNGTEVAKK